MNRTVLGLLFAVCSTAYLSSQMSNMNAPTFTKDVAPILQKNCQSCHRPARLLRSQCSRTRRRGPEPEP